MARFGRGFPARRNAPTRLRASLGALTATVSDGDQFTASPTTAVALTAVVLDADTATATLVSATSLAATLLDGDTTTASPVSATALSATLVESDTATATLVTPAALSATVRDSDTATAVPTSATALAAAVLDSDTVLATPTAGTGLTATVLDGDTATATLATAPGIVATVVDGDAPTAVLASAMALAAAVADADLLAATLGTPAALSATLTDGDAFTAMLVSATVLAAPLVDSDAVTAVLQTAVALTVTVLDGDTATATLVTSVSLSATLPDGDSITVTLATAVTLAATVADGDMAIAVLATALTLTATLGDGDLLTAGFTTRDRIFAVPDPLRGADDWTFAVGAWTGLPDTVLPQITSRRVTWRLAGNSDATFTIDSELPEAGQIHELISDLWVLWKGRPVYRGRVGTTGDTGDGSAYSTTVNAVDYRDILRRRQLYEGDTLSWLNLDQALIGWNVLSQTQARPGGDLRIVRGAGQATGVLRDRTDYQPGKSVGEALDQLSAVDNGFDYDFSVVLDGNRRPTTGLGYDVYYPARGVDRRVVLNHPGAIASFNRTADPSGYANALRVTGDTALAAVRVEASDIATRPEGRWDAQFGDTSIVNAGTLAARAKAELAARQLVLASWTVTLADSVWQGPDHIWLGDPITLAVQKGRLNVVGTLRVQELSVALDESSVPTVSLTLGAPPPHSRWNLRRLDRRLQALERR